MKTTKYEIVETPIDITVTEARLLTKEEAEALPERLIRYPDWWWTKSAWDGIFAIAAWIVYGNSSSVDYSRIDLWRDVRPALIFESKDLKVGNKFLFGGKEFEVIKEGLAFCTTDIGKCAFRKDWKAEDANQYEASDVKKYVDKWFEEAIK